MASLEELLLRYRIYNDPQARRYTTRLSAMLLLVAVALTAGFMAFADGPDATLEAGSVMLGGEDQPPDQVAVTETAEGVYIGYPTHAYDPDRDYDRSAIVAAVVDWQADHPDAFVERTFDVEADDGTLLGYQLVLRQGRL